MTRHAASSPIDVNNSDVSVLNDPANHVIATFIDRTSANAALAELKQRDMAPADAVLLVEESAAEDIDASARWFADTDELVKRYQEDLRMGKCVLCLPEPDENRRVDLIEVLKAHGANLVTHSGQWLTESF